MYFNVKQSNKLSYSLGLRREIIIIIHKTFKYTNCNCNAFKFLHNFYKSYPIKRGFLCLILVSLKSKNHALKNYDRPGGNQEEFKIFSLND